jgi:hypothetical protein
MGLNSAELNLTEAVETALSQLHHDEAAPSEFL